jgi:DNA-binding CsgD family transcriptional regulator
MLNDGISVETWALNVVQFLGHGGFLLDGGRLLLAHNKAAMSYLGNGLTLSAGRVIATDRHSDARLQSLIDTSLKSVRDPNGPASVGVRRELRLPLFVRVLRLEGSSGTAVSSVRLLLMACDPERGQMPRYDMLADMFGLTPAEARVAAGIAAGRRLVEIAADGGVKITTVQTHSKAVFGKTGTRGQAELAMLLTRLAVLNPKGS